MKAKLLVYIILLCISFGYEGQIVYADSSESEFAIHYRAESGMTFQELLNKIRHGELTSVKSFVLEQIKDSYVSEIQTHRQRFKHLCFMIVFLSILTNLGQAFRGGEVAKMGFLIGYVSVISFVILSFTELSQYIRQSLNSLNEFMSALIPVYAVSIGVNAKEEATVFYQIALVVIQLSELMLLNVVVPMIHIYLCIGIVNQLSDEDYFSKTCDFIKSGMDFLLKLFIGVVISLDVIQKMISGAQGGRVEQWIQTLTSNSTLPVAGLIMGTGKTIRDTLGLAGILFLLILVLAPIMKVMIFIIFYKLLNAVIQPISDKRLIRCFELVGNAGTMFAKILFYHFLMFELTIGIVCI